MINKDMIVESYKALVLKNKTTKISVKELSQNIGISRTTFYKYFKDTYDIIEYIFVSDAMIPMETLINNNINSKTIVENWYSSFYRNKDFYQLAIKENGQNSLFDTIILQITEYNKTLYCRNFDGDDLEYYSYKYAAVQAMLLKKWMIEGMRIQPEKMAEYFMHNMLSGQI